MSQRNTPAGRVRGTPCGATEAARTLRRRMTPAEQLIWSALRRPQVDGLSFRRQHAVGPYILVFFCPALKLVVEVDGDIHEQLVEQDTFRTKHLESFGYRVLRVRNNDVLNDQGAVLERIRLATQEP